MTTKVSSRPFPIFIALALLLMLVGMMAQSTPHAVAQDLPPAELHWYFVGWTVQDLQMVEDKVNELLQPKINASVKLHLIDWGSYPEKIKLLAASGEECDLMLLSPQWNPYTPMVANGALLPLDDLLPEYAPNLWASMPPDVWDAARVGGKIYGVINQGLQANAYGIWLRKDLMEKYNFDWTQAKSYADLEPLLQAIADNEPEITIFSAINAPHGRLWFPLAWGIDSIGSPSDTLGIRYDDESLTVVINAETEEYRTAVDMAKKWYDAGYFPADPPSDSDAQANRAAGLVTGMIWNRIPGIDYFVATGEYGGREIVQLTLTPPVMTTGTVTNSMTGVCATSKNPERAVMLLDLVNTDGYLISTLVRGVEGVHWVWDDQSKNLTKLPEGKTPDEINAAYRAPDWVFGNKFNLYYSHPSQLGSYEEIRQLNEEAIRSVALGLVIDYSSVRTEMAQVEAVWKQYGDPIERGMVDDMDKALAEYQSKLKEAGIDVILAEAQKQVVAWKATKGS